MTRQRIAIRALVLVSSLSIVGLIVYWKTAGSGSQSVSRAASDAPTASVNGAKSNDQVSGASGQGQAPASAPASRTYIMHSSKSAGVVSPNEVTY